MTAEHELPTAGLDADAARWARRFNDRVAEICDGHADTEHFPCPACGVVFCHYWTDARPGDTCGCAPGPRCVVCGDWHYPEDVHAREVIANARRWDERAAADELPEPFDPYAERAS